MDLTDEQLSALAFFRLGMTLTVQALAGTGKTSTAQAMGESTNRPGSFVAYNKMVIVDAAQRMPPNIACATSHSLAFRAVGRNYAHRLNGPRMRSADIARLLRLDHLVTRYGSQTKVLQPGFLASLVMRSLKQFAFTGDEQPGPEHIPYLDGIDPPTADGGRTWTNNLAVRAHIAPTLDQAWADIMDPGGQLPYVHDFYAKAWEMGEPRIPGDFILADELQDANGLMLSVLARQDAQLIGIGDANQQLYAWRGSIDALDKIPSEATSHLTRSFRFGPEIADLANLVLDELGCDLRLLGSDIDSRVERIAGLPDAVLCRSNAEAVRTVLSLQRDGIDPHLVGSAGQQVVSFAEAAEQLAAGVGTTHPELACFDSWPAVRAYVDQDPSGGELALLVALVDEFTPEVIVKALAHMPGEEAAAVVVSTAHAAKGREWSRVRLAGDFQQPEGQGAAGEWRLGYVACTRAQHVLDITECEYLTALTDGAGSGSAGRGAASSAASRTRPLPGLDGQHDGERLRPDHPDGDEARPA